MSMSDVIAQRRAQSAYDKWAAANPAMVTAYQATPEGRFAIGAGARDSAIGPAALTGMYQQTGGDVNKLATGMQGDLYRNYPTLFQPADSGGFGGLGSFYSSLGVAAPILLAMAGANAMGYLGSGAAGASGAAGNTAGAFGNAITTGEFVPQSMGAMDYLKTAKDVMGTLNTANNLLGGGQQQPAQQPMQQPYQQPAQQGLNPMAVGTFGAKNLGYSNGGLAQFSRRM